MLTFIVKHDARRARYLCECGKETIVFVSNVNRGHTTSCGCLRRLASSERFLTHGHKANGKRSRAYATWVNMKSRCTNPRTKSFKDYGGRGITVCQEWSDSFEAFLRDMGEPEDGMSIDRKDNDKGYSPDNCQWASDDTQALNKRNCVRYDLNGESKTLAEWSRQTGIGRVTMLKRIQRGVPLGLALTVTGFLKMPKNVRGATL